MKNSTKSDGTKTVVHVSYEWSYQPYKGLHRIRSCSAPQHHGFSRTQKFRQGRKTCKSYLSNFDGHFRNSKEKFWEIHFGIEYSNVFFLLAVQWHRGYRTKILSQLCTQSTTTQCLYTYDWKIQNILHENTKRR